MSDSEFCVMLVDDHPPTNFLNKRELKKTGKVNHVIEMTNAELALKYLKKDNNQKQPEFIFLDINMPGMNGWEFLEIYQSSNDYHEAEIIVMLTTSLNPDDKEKSKQYSKINSFENKPLTQEKIGRIFAKYNL